MLTERHFWTPEWLAALLGGECILVRGHVGEHLLEAIKAMCPRGVLSLVVVDVPAVDDLAVAFFSAVMPATFGEVPRHVYVLTAVSAANIDALCELHARQPWVQWVAVVPDMDSAPVIPPGILPFDAKLGNFSPPASTSLPALEWARRVLADAITQDEIVRRVSAEGPKILAAINAVTLNAVECLPATLGQLDATYLDPLLAFACDLAGVEGEDINALGDKVRESAVAQGVGPTLESPAPPAHPQVFEGGKAMPLYAPGDPVAGHASEWDAIRRDPEVHIALLKLLEQVSCEDCAEPCHSPEQKWACLREGTWQVGVPSCIVDQWLSIFAPIAAQVGREARAAYQAFAGAMQKVEVPLPTIAEGEFAVLMDLAPERNAPPLVSSLPLESCCIDPIKELDPPSDHASRPFDAAAESSSDPAWQESLLTQLEQISTRLAVIRAALGTVAKDPLGAGE